MGNIVLLDELTINKIAAGEVIERPASVIKEMVENSIDAGATNITVEIKNGGISYIKVSDNGKGIAQDDMEIAFERHATSKIRSADDLNTVTSMGFRGEALASIAAIANVEMVSKTESQETGYRIVVEGGNVLEQEETGCRTGTTITVQNLFFNTPVRYKFLKKDYTESGYIEDVITRIALVNPDVAIKLINTGKTVIQTNGNGDLKSVIYSIYGKDVANAIMEVSYKYEDITVTGVVGKPEIARSNRSNQLFFVNKRHIKDKTLTAATEQAYKGLIPIGKFGFVVLNLEMSPAKVDVNVHPAKLEVRFQEENKVFQAIYHAIKETMLKGELVANVEKPTENDLKKASNRNAKSFEQRLKNLKEKKETTNTNSGGLFGFRKHADKKIEKYTDEESKIKTNILGDIYNTRKGITDDIGVREEDEKYNIPQEDKAQTPNEKAQITNKDKKDKFKSSEEDLEIPRAFREDKLEMSKVLNDAKLEVPKALQEDKSTNIEENSNKYETKKMENTVVEILREASRKNIEDNNLEQDLKANLQDVEGRANQEQDIEEKVDIQNIDTENEKTSKNVAETETMAVSANAVTEGNTDLTPDANNDTEAETENNANEMPKNFDEMYEKLFGKAPQSKIEQEEKEAKKVSAVDIMKDNISMFEAEEELQKPTYRFIGIAFKTYIILEIDDEMYILDQHAAHERIMYEKVKKNYYSGEDKESQMLLLPDVITLTHKEMDIARENKEMFEQAGFTLEEFGDNTIKLTGVPNICLNLDTKDLFLETLDEINTVARTAKQEKEEKFIATVACKAAVKANMALTVEEVDSLMDKLLELPNPFTCPHGRPTAIKMTKYDIERKFSRK